MKLTITDMPDTKTELLVVGIFTENSDLYENMNKELSEKLKDALYRKAFKLEFGTEYSTSITKSLYKEIHVIGLGSAKEFTTEKLRRAMSIAVKYAKEKFYETFTTNMAELALSTGIKPDEIGRASAEGLILSDYTFNKYKEEKKKGKIETANLSWKEEKTRKAFEEGIGKGRIISEATNYAKELVNEPAHVSTPSYLANEAKKLEKNGKIKVKIIEKVELVKNGMNLFLSVGKGSEQKTKLIIIEYKNSNEPATAIVGKGITFDSGGYDLKPEEHMGDMKCDMAGAAAVLGTIKAASALQLKKNIIGIIPACENLVSGGAYKPGDILKAYNGKTVEILNTDAEGRLVLADAIAYAEHKFKPATIIDLATLTGSCIRALGYIVTGMVCTSEELAKHLKDAGEKSYDRVWQFPFYEEYQDNMDGDVSDLKNMSNKPDPAGAGAILGAVFLSKFVKKAKWAHLDIAGTAYQKEESYYTQKYGSGAGVRLLTYHFME